jgi:hypothetical protein
MKPNGKNLVDGFSKDPIEHVVGDLSAGHLQRERERRRLSVLSVDDGLALRRNLGYPAHDLPREAARRHHVGTFLQRPQVASSQRVAHAWE